MLAVIFEVFPTTEGKAEYLEIAAELRGFLENRDGFRAAEKIKYPIMQWRNLLEHRTAQKKGKEALFKNYRIRVANVVRDYSGTERDEAPSDSKMELP